MPSAWKNHNNSDLLRRCIQNRDVDCLAQRSPDAAARLFAVIKNSLNIPLEPRLQQRPFLQGHEAGFNFVHQFSADDTLLGSDQHGQVGETSGGCAQLPTPLLCQVSHRLVQTSFENPTVLDVPDNTTELQLYCLTSTIIIMTMKPILKRYFLKKNVGSKAIDNFHANTLSKFKSLTKFNENTYTYCPLSVYRILYLG